jgi:hypothetical protein
MFCDASSPGDQRPGLFDPIVARDAAIEFEVGVELVGFFLGHGANLPIVENAVIVELLDDLGADAGQFGQIVRCAARRGEQLEMLGRGGVGLDDLGQFLDQRRLGGALVEALRALAA